MGGWRGWAAWTRAEKDLVLQARAFGRGLEQICVVAPSGGPQGHNCLHDCTGRGRIGWKRGEVITSANHARCVQYTAVYKAQTIFQNGSQYLQNTDTNPQSKFPLVFYSRRCSIPTGAQFPKVTHLGAGGWGHFLITPPIPVKDTLC